MSETDQNWQADLDKRTEHLEGLRAAARQLPAQRHLADRLRRQVRDLLKPLIQAWHLRMRKARTPSPAQVALAQQLRAAKAARPNRHWAGLILKLQILGLRLLVILIILIKIAVLIGLIVAIVIVAILAWRQFQTG